LNLLDTANSDMISEARRKIFLGYLLIFSITLFLGIVTYLTNKKSFERSKSISHTNEVLYHIEQLLSLTIDIETGQRGYNLTGNYSFLEPCIIAKKNIHHHLKLLENLIQDNSLQLSRLKKVNMLVNKKVIFSNQVIDLNKFGSSDSVRNRMLTLEGKIYMDSIRYTVKQMQQEEKNLLKLRTEAQKKELKQFYFIFALLIITFVTVLIVLYFVINSNLTSLENASRKIDDLFNNSSYGYLTIRSDKRLIDVNDTILEWIGYSKEELKGALYSDILVPEKPQEFETYRKGLYEKGWVNGIECNLLCKNGSVFPIVINAIAIKDEKANYIETWLTVFDNREGKVTENRILQLNKELADNISKLEHTNRELESFTYSISHDLRAPLRSIVGYTTILKDDYAPLFDDEGRRIAKIIRNNALKMGNLIDDLLTFSHMGKKELVKGQIDMKHLVQGVIIEILSQYPHKEIEIEVEEMGTVKADVGLIRQAWINLIANAIKYSGTQQKPSVKIGCRNNEHEVTYFVKDNGVGFDMAYAHKLFGVFQRLHKQDEFEGTGVGLAIVQRIIQKHGGNVWAEAMVNIGATFYFTLPKNE
jgi:PAS domain S-box-containing protein